MYRCLIVLIFALSLANAFAQPGRIDITHSKLNLQFDWNKKSAFGTATISLTLLSDADEVHLRGDELKIASVKSGGRSLSFKLDNVKHDVIVSLGRKYNAHDKLELVIPYETTHRNEPDPNLLGGSWGNGLRFFQPTKVNPIKRKQIWSQSEAEVSSFWFPGSHDANDLRTTEFIATVDKNLTVISNGDLLSTKDNRNGTRTFHYKSTVPYAGYLTSFVVGEYTEYVQQYKNTPLRTFCYPDELEAAKATTERLPAMVKFLEEKTGMAYPFKSYAQVMVQDYPFPGLTGQHMATIISDNMIDDKGTHHDYLYLWDGVEFNALASQWFGSVITPASWKDVWLTKSLAQYYEGLFTDAANGHGEYLLWYHPWETGSVFGDWTNGNRHAIVPEQINNVENFVGDSYAKFRGALVLRMLNLEIGEENFTKVMQHFIKANVYKAVSTKDLQQSVKFVTGSDLQWFFEQWIYKTGHPVFEVLKNYDANQKQLELTIRQVQKPDSTGSYPQAIFFQGKMEIEMDDKLEVVHLKAQRENVFTFPRVTNPKLVQVDFENTWLKELAFPKSIEENLYQFQNDKDVAGRQKAMLDLVSAFKQESTPEEVKKKIDDAFYNVINSNVYWRMRLLALGQLGGLLPKPYTDDVRHFLLTLIKKEKSWIRASAITLLGSTSDKQYDKVYIECFADSSDRVIAAAAVALGKTKSPAAFDALVKLKDRPSWKSQSLMHCLSGLAQLGDPRGVSVALNALADVHSPRWFLGNGWDYPFIAAQTLYALNDVSKAHEIVFERLQTAMAENDISDIFHHVLLISTLADPHGQQAFNLLKKKFKNDSNLLAAVATYESQYQDALKAKQ